MKKEKITLSPCSENCTPLQNSMLASLILSFTMFSEQNDRELTTTIIRISPKSKDESGLSRYELAQAIVGFRRGLYTYLANIVEDKCYEAGPYMEVARQAYTATVIKMFIICSFNHPELSNDEWEERLVKDAHKYLGRKEEEAREMAKIAIKFKDDLRNHMLNTFKNVQ